MFVAVMSAAFLGNIYFHLMRDFQTIAGAGVSGAIAIMLPRILYSFLLGIGVYLSMQRQQRRRGSIPEPVAYPRMLRLRNIAVVWLFYSLIHIWNVEPITLSLAERFRFFLGLVGVT